MVAMFYIIKNDCPIWKLGSVGPMIWLFNEVFILVIRITCSVNCGDDESVTLAYDADDPTYIPDSDDYETDEEEDDFINKLR